jgi:hypothetical protein
LHNKQHSQETDIRASGGIRTRNSCKRAAADPCLRQRGHRNWPVLNKFSQKNLMFNRVTHAVLHPIRRLILNPSIGHANSLVIVTIQRLLMECMFNVQIETNAEADVPAVANV